MAQDVLITPASGKIEFDNSAGALSVTIQENSGDLSILPTGDLIIGDGTPGNIEFGGSGVPVSVTLLGGGEISSNGNALDIGISGDTINLNVTGVTYNLPSTVPTLSSSNTWTGTQTFSGNLTLNAHLTWNTGKNIYVGGESSFDLNASGATWLVWDGSNSTHAIYVPYGGQVQIGNAGSRGVNIIGTTSTKNVLESTYSLTGTALDPGNGGVQFKTLSGATTFTDSLVNGETMTLRLVNGSSYTVTWPTMTWVTTSGNVAPTLHTRDVLVFWKESNVLYGAFVGYY